MNVNAKLTLVIPPPPPIPESTIHVTVALSLEEAKQLRAVYGNSNTGINREVLQKAAAVAVYFRPLSNVEAAHAVQSFQAKLASALQIQLEQSGEVKESR